MNLDDLHKPFPVDAVHWRIGSTNIKKVKRETGDQNAKPTKGIPLAYIDARDVMRRLDKVCGPENWQCRYPMAGCCDIGIKMPLPSNITDVAPRFEWVWKANGAGETAVEGTKGQYSDAFKRAAVLWGIGQYLYDIPNTWVDLGDWGKFEAPKLPQWATPAGWARLPKSQRDEVYKQTLECLSNGDSEGLSEVWAEFSKEEHIQLWSMFDSLQRSAIKELRK